jgi:UDP-N-acetylmuramoylalanine--D-glutamate ligase
MDEYQSFFEGKRITVMGLGLLGGIGDIRYLAERGTDLIVTDLKSEAELQPSLDQLKEFKNVRYTLGRHDLADFENRDLIVKAPATPLDSPYIVRAKEKNIPVTMWAALFARFAKEKGSTIVGVTGTRGKTTTTAMLSAILRTARKKVIEGGNIQGTSMLPHLSELSADAYVVLELDSWKIQGFRDEKISPHVAVFTTFYPDHLNYYGGDMDLYLADKAEIFLHQTAEDTLILGEQCEEMVQKKYEDKIPSMIVIAHAEDVPVEWRMKIPGAHNRSNAACALQASRALVIADEFSKQALEKFEGVEGRLQFLREVKGIKVYNDTTSTTPDATIAALTALDPDNKQNILLIMGGADKGLDMSGMREAVHAHCKRVFLLAGTGTERIQSDAPDAPVFASLEAATAAARDSAEEGDIILLSPAFASFGMFKNEYDRGEQFNELVATFT